MAILLLSVKNRQSYLKTLGFYKGKVDGKAGKLTKAAYKALQDRYFLRKKDRDGKYGRDTDTLLRSAYNCRGLKYFKLEEFRCKCNGKCTGYPAVISRSLVTKLDSLIRPKYGATTITSGLRCKAHNKSEGGASNSRHTKGKAADWKNGESCKGSVSRNAIIRYCNKNFHYSYGNTAAMGSSIHTDV